MRFDSPALAVNKRDKRVQRLQGKFMFVFSCINCVCFGWADAETSRMHLEPGEKKIIVSLLILVIKWQVKFSFDKCSDAYICSRSHMAVQMNE